MDNSYKCLDSYSLLIVSKYFREEKDYINVMCVCKKFQETTEKLRFNPIPVTSMKLFPMIQTQYLYSNDDTKIDGIDNYEIWYKVDYDTYLKFNNENTKCHHIQYTKNNKEFHGENIPSSVTELDDWCYEQISELLFSGYDRTIKDITIPNHVTHIGESCFISCSDLTKVVLSSNILHLHEGCFSCCDSLNSIEIPTTVQTFGNSCFSNCSKLTEITIPASVIDIGSDCFFGM
ncbi:Leucine rich repeat protein [Entamoeba marina]